jgi:hypothetical protein
MPATPASKKKYFSVSEANAMLPLVRAIVGDITELAGTVRDRQERLAKLKPTNRRATKDAYQEELDQLQAAIERDHDRMRELLTELTGLGIELKDPFTGLIDFPCWMNNREVYLCWKHGEPTVAHWHELDAWFAGRQKLVSERAGPAAK